MQGSLQTTDIRHLPVNTQEGLSTLTTMVTSFSRVVGYRTYRLWNKKCTLSAEEGMDMYKLRRSIDGLHPTLSMFTGANTITLLGFLGTMRDELDTTGATEGSDLKVPAYYL